MQTWTGYIGKQFQVKDEQPILDMQYIPESYWVGKYEQDAAQHDPKITTDLRYKKKPSYRN